MTTGIEKKSSVDQKHQFFECMSSTTAVRYHYNSLRCNWTDIL